MGTLLRGRRVTVAPVGRRRVIAHQSHEIDRPALRPERPVSAASDGLILDEIASLYRVA